jgi:hypothetical protein
MNYSRVLAVLILISSCTPEASPPRFAVVELGFGASPCATVDGLPIAPGTPVAVHTLNPPGVIIGKIGTPVGACDENADLPGTSYSLTLEEESEYDGLGIGVLASHESGELQFRDCTSSEGAHLTVWRGEKNIWHRYYYVPYDTEPTCTDAEAARWIPLE